MSCFNKYKENKEYQQEYIWKCRNFELSYLWQRSIFLTAFFVLIYTAYFTLWRDFFSLEVDKEPLILNVISIFIMLIGFVFSILWICMAKGSKFWVEIYENKISEFENLHRKDFEAQGLNKDEGKTNPNNNGLFFKNSRKAYRYSVSRINIMIGQVLAYVSAILYIIHNLYLLHFLYNKYKHTIVLNNCKCIISIISIIICLYILFFISSKIKKLLESP